ncbi:MAG: glycosyltransferase family 4 protein [Acidimicrobiia bacterium]|nr:glycosyltransferase family 4 protein [Acidimicrobiia bacterium]
MQARPTLWEAHFLRVAALDAMGRNTESWRARLAAAFLTAEAGIPELGLRWFEKGKLERFELAARCDRSGEGAHDLARDLMALGGTSAAGTALKRLMAWRGPEAIPLDPLLPRVLSERDAVTLAIHMRQAGTVRRALDLLEMFEPSPTIERALRGPAQDLRAIDGLIALPSLGTEPIDTVPGTSLYLLHNSLPLNSGGYATRTHGLLKGLAAAGRNVIPITRPGYPDPERSFEQDISKSSDVTVDDITYRRIIGEVTATPRQDLQGFVETYARGLEPHIRSAKPTIIHAASNWWNGIAGIAVARRYGLRSIYEVRGLWEVTKSSRVDAWQESEVYHADVAYETLAAREADRVFVITEALRDEMVSRGVSADKMSVVPNAVDTTAFFPRQRNRELAKELGIKNATVVIGFAGSMTFYEGLGDLLVAVAQISETTNVPLAVLLVGDGPVRDELQSSARELGIEQLTIFTGRVPHEAVMEYLSLMDVTPFPRQPLPVTEMVSPLKPLESMASGVAVLASDVAALRELVPPGTGLLHRKGDVEDLTEQLRMLVEDRDLRDSLRTAALEWVRNNRTWEVVAAEVARVYDALEAG